MNVFLAYDDHDAVCGVFTSVDAARGTFGPLVHIEQRMLMEHAIAPWPYWHRGASVYPDGTFDEFNDELIGHGDPAIGECDAKEPWDGHLQQHCGKHISIFGRDKDKVDAAFEHHLRAAIERQDGICKSRFAGEHGGLADGRATYQAGSGKVRPSMLRGRE